MTRSGVLRTIAALSIGPLMMSGCGQQNRFVGLWKRVNPTDDPFTPMATIAQLSITDRTIEPIDDKGKTTMTIPYELVEPDEAVGTAFLGVGIKFKLVSPNTLTITPGDVSFTKT